MANPQQGWYPDPQDASRVRWWDGTEWTQYTQPHPHVTAAADEDGEDLDDLTADTPATRADSSAHRTAEASAEAHSSAPSTTKHEGPSSDATATDHGDPTEQDDRSRSEAAAASAPSNRSAGTLTMDAPRGGAGSRTSAVPSTWHGTYRDDPTSSVKSVQYAEPGTATDLPHASDDEDEQDTRSADAATDETASSSDAAATTPHGGDNDPDVSNDADSSTRVVQDLLTEPSIPVVSDDTSVAPDGPVTAELDAAPGDNDVESTREHQGTAAVRTANSGGHADTEGTSADPQVLHAEHDMSFVHEALRRSHQTDRGQAPTSDDQPANRAGTAVDLDDEASEDNDTDITDTDFTDTDIAANDADGLPAQAAEPSAAVLAKADEQAGDDDNAELADVAPTQESTATRERDGAKPNGQGQKADTSEAADDSEATNEARGAEDAEPAAEGTDDTESRGARSPGERAALLESRVALSDRATKAEVAAQTARYELHLLTEQNASEERTLSEAIELSQREVEYSKRHERACKDEQEMARIAREEAEQREQRAHEEYEAAKAATLESEQEAERVADKARQLLKRADERREEMQRKLLAASEELDAVRGELAQLSEGKRTPRVGRHRTRKTSDTERADAAQAASSLSSASGTSLVGAIRRDPAPETDQFWRATNGQDGDTLSAASAAVLAAGRPETTSNDRGATSNQRSVAGSEAGEPGECNTPSTRDTDSSTKPAASADDAENTTPAGRSDSKTRAGARPTETSSSKTLVGDDGPHKAVAKDDLAANDGPSRNASTTRKQASGADSSRDEPPTSSQSATSKPADTDQARGVLLEQGPVRLAADIVEDAAEPLTASQQETTDTTTSDASSQAPHADEPQVQRSPRWDEDNPAGPVPLRSGLRLGPMVDPDDYNVDNDVPMTGAQVLVKGSESRTKASSTSQNTTSQNTASQNTAAQNTAADDTAASESNSAAKPDEELDSSVDDGVQPKSAQAVAVTGAEIPDLTGPQKVVEIDPMTGSVVAVDDEPEPQPKSAQMFAPDEFDDAASTDTTYEPEVIDDEPQPKTAVVIEPTPVAVEDDEATDTSRELAEATQDGRSLRDAQGGHNVAAVPTKSSAVRPDMEQSVMPATGQLTGTVSAADRATAQRHEVASGSLDEQPEFADRSSRLAAAVIDTVLLTVLVGAFTFSPLLTLVDVLRGGESAKTLGVSGYLLLGGALLVIPFVYGLLCYRFGGETVGNKLLGTRVAAGNGSPELGWGQAAIRSAVKYPITMLGSAVFGLGLVNYAWCLRPEQQCLHDVIADTFVVVPDGD